MTSCSYTHLNPRFNPFGTLTPEEEAAAALPDLDASVYAARLRQPGTAIQFLGPSGRGKTSHLMALRSRFPAAPYLHIGRGEPVPPLPEAAILFVDEMQRVPRRQRQALFARHAAYVVGSHVDHSHEFARAGLDYEIITLGAVTALRLQAVLNRRIAVARRHPQRPVPTFTLAAVEMLLACCGADQWAMNGILYDLFETLAEARDLEPSLAALLNAYRMPWQRRLLKLETPALAGLIEFVVGLGAAVGRRSAAVTGRL
jgi:hypothetical protein